MSANFWAGYSSGAAGFLIGNPLDLLKVRLQAGTVNPAVSVSASSPSWRRPSSLIKGSCRGLGCGYRKACANHSMQIKGVTAPILGCGALNALLYVSYTYFLLLVDPAVTDPTHPVDANLFKIWSAGAVGGLATWLGSTPTELIKCRTQLSPTEQSSWEVARQLWKWHGLRGLYHGGGITSVRDSVGFGF